MRVGKALNGAGSVTISNYDQGSAYMICNRSKKPYNMRCLDIPIYMEAKIQACAYTQRRSRYSRNHGDLLICASALQENRRAALR